MTSLRVISGKAKGRRLRSVPGNVTRPITDRAKESLFNIIGNDISEATFLDLFAGTGSVGIEALSRGAKFARFLDSHRLAVETILANLALTGLLPAGEVLHLDAFKMLGFDPDRTFDYIFIAPPQYQDIWKRAITTLDAKPLWLSPDAWVIVQIHPIEYEAVKLSHLMEFDRRHYGSVMFVFFSPN
jgi:16S rRNA (guanine966-N2)-methyltransferase